MQIIFDTTNKQDLNILEVLFKNLDINVLKPEQSAQPEVAGNTGSTATGVSSLSPEGSGVSGAGEATPTADDPAPAPEKAKRTRKPKAEAPEVKSGGEYVPNEPAAEQPKSEPADTAVAQTSDPATFTLDEVRAALQTFTAAKGVPAGIELLKKFSAGRISELADTDYASFVAECQA